MFLRFRCLDVAAVEAVPGLVGIRVVSLTVLKAPSGAWLRRWAGLLRLTEAGIDLFSLSSLSLFVRREGIDVERF